MKKCLIYLDNGQIQNSLDLLEAAKEIYQTEPYETFIIMNDGSLNGAYGFADNIILLDGIKIESYDLETITDYIACVHKEFEFDAILIPGTWQGRMLAPRLAIRLHAGLTADVTEIRHNNGKLELVRPAFSGRLLAGIQMSGEGPIMMSVRQNVFKYTHTSDKISRIIRYRYQAEINCKIRLTHSSLKERSYNISDSEVLISGGGGVSQGFDKLEELATLLNGQVSASRQIVDKGIADRYIQVGQSGKTVSPKLYMAIGISGAIQHVEGLKNVSYIISVNTNKSAPICSLSDIIVEGDALEFIDRLAERIRKYKEEIKKEENQSK